MNMWEKYRNYNSTNVRFIYPKNFILTFLLFLSAFHLFAQPWPVPQLPDTTNYGRYISRTMYLLQTSTPEKPNTVKILVYGQSISVQDWWLDVKKKSKSASPIPD